MSQNKYTLQLVVDDTALKNLEKRLGGIMGTSTSTTSSQGGKSPMGNLAKLGIIAAGVGGILAIVKKIADLTVDASPMLQAMLQLLDNTVMFILRPIGDFIGFILRPIMIFLLRYVAIPFYKHFAPLAARYGDKIGRAAESILKWIFPKAGKPAASSQVGGMIMGPMGFILGPIFEHVGRALVDNVIKGIRDIFEKIFQVIQGFLRDPIGSIARPALQTATQAIQPEINVALHIEQNIGDFAQHMEKQAADWFQTLFKKGFNP